jgi:hypothetical protein
VENPEPLSEGGRTGCGERRGDSGGVVPPSNAGGAGPAAGATRGLGGEESGGEGCGSGGLGLRVNRGIACGVCGEHGAPPPQAGPDVDVLRVCAK